MSYAFYFYYFKLKHFECILFISTLKFWSRFLESEGKKSQTYLLVGWISNAGLLINCLLQAMPMRGVNFFYFFYEFSMMYTQPKNLQIYTITAEWNGYSQKYVALFFIAFVVILQWLVQYKLDYTSSIIYFHIQALVTFTKPRYIVENCCRITLLLTLISQSYAS